MNVRSSNDVSCYPAPSEVDSNHGNPCSLVGVPHQYSELVLRRISELP